MKAVKTIPNEPALIVAVKFTRTMQRQFGPHRGKTIIVPMQFVGASAREVSAEMGAAERSRTNVIWEFFRGDTSGGDDPVAESPWHKYRVEIPPDVRDICSFIESGIFQGYSNFNWYLMEPEQPRMS